MNKFHFYISIIVELTACVVMSVGLAEKIIFNIENPANWTFNLGCLLTVIGSIYFAKYIKIKNLK